jgi:hypothetical protein
MMAVINNILCTLCGEVKQEYGPIDGRHTKVCFECSSKLEAESRKQRLEVLKELSLEDRIARIEEWIEDFKFPTDIRDIRF